MAHVIAAAIYDGLLAFEYSIAREILGRDRRNLVAGWYDFLPCQAEPGRLFSSHGLEIRPTGSLGDLHAADTILMVVREDFGLTAANAIARRMVAPVHRDGGQSQYAESPVGVSEGDRFGPVLDWMASRFDQPFAIERVARRFGYSLRTFQRRFKEMTNQSPHRWLVEQRVSRARELLESSDSSVEQVAARSGFGSAANLRKHLARYLGTTPRAYRSAFRAVS